MEIKAFSPLTTNYHYKEHTLSFNDIVRMNQIMQTEPEFSYEYHVTEKYLKVLGISQNRLESMASSCQTIEICALKALITLDFSAMGEYLEVSSNAYRWDLSDGDNWNVEESEAGKVAFVVCKFHIEETKGHIWSDVKVKGKELKKYSDILDDLDDEEEY